MIRPEATFEDVERVLHALYWPLLSAQVPIRQPVSDLLLSRLDEDGLADVERVAPDDSRAMLARPNLRKHALLMVAVHCVPRLAETLGLPRAVPPDDVHRMQKGPLWCGDFFSADMVGQAIQDSGLRIASKQRYLDMGCSSGSLTRVMQAAYPDSVWHGVDPNGASIEWASKSLPGIRFDRSPQSPPLEFPASFFDGIYAISIWSHFSERAAVAWISEMARILKPGGWLVFTTHGAATLHRHAKRRVKRAEKLASLLSSLIEHDYAFESLPAINGLDMTDWGNSYLSVDWVARQLDGESWSLHLFQPGRNQGTQDVYVLIRR